MSLTNKEGLVSEQLKACGQKSSAGISIYILAATKTGPFGPSVFLFSACACGLHALSLSVSSCLSSSWLLRLTRFLILKQVIIGCQDFSGLKVSIQILESNY